MVKAELERTEALTILKSFWALESHNYHLHLLMPFKAELYPSHRKTLGAGEEKAREAFIFVFYEYVGGKYCVKLHLWPTSVSRPNF